MPGEIPSPTTPDRCLLKHRILEACGLIEGALCHCDSGSPWQGDGPGLSILTRGGDELRVVLGPSGAGKTTLAASLVSRLIEDGGRDERLAWFSLQESGGQAALRLLCHATRMPLARVAAGDVSSRRDLARLTKVAHALAEYPVRIEDVSPLSVAVLRARCEEWKEQGDLPLVVIDPIEALEDDDGSRWGSSSQASEDITISLRRLAEDLGTPVVAFASTPAELDDANSVPSPTSLPESLAPLVSAADLVLFLETGKRRPGDGVVAAALHVLKQSDGSEDAVIPLIFRPGLMLFEGVE